MKNSKHERQMELKFSIDPNSCFILNSTSSIGEIAHALTHFMAWKNYCHTIDIKFLEVDLNTVRRHEKGVYLKFNVEFSGKAHKFLTSKIQPKDAVVDIVNDVLCSYYSSDGIMIKVVNQEK
jgi:hypothetical protein